MELKKYVLTKDNKILEIHGKSTHGYTYVDYEKEGIIFTRTILEQDITKTSDNVLQLLVEGDLIKVLGTIAEVLEVEGRLVHFKSLTGRTIISMHKSVTEIYKKEPNGDFKKFKVTGEENV